MPSHIKIVSIRWTSSGGVNHDDPISDGMTVPLHFTVCGTNGIPDINDVYVSLTPQPFGIASSVTADQDPQYPNDPTRWIAVLSCGHAGTWKLEAFGTNSIDEYDGPYNLNCVTSLRMREHRTDGGITIIYPKILATLGKSVPKPVAAFGTAPHDTQVVVHLIKLHTDAGPPFIRVIPASQAGGLWGADFGNVPISGPAILKAKRALGPGGVQIDINIE
jgi:hypothetical protein